MTEQTTTGQVCGAEPPSDGYWGDCWCTLPSGHDGEHRCEPCMDRHGAPGWTDDPAGCSPAAGETEPNNPADDLAQSGVSTPGCDCGHDGMGRGWHLSWCAWKAGAGEARSDLGGEFVAQADSPDLDAAEAAVADLPAPRDAELDRLRAQLVKVREFADLYARSCHVVRAEAGRDLLALLDREAGRG